MRGLPLAAVSVAVLAAAAGCLEVDGGGDGSMTPSTSALAPEPVVSDTTGAIAGVVTDEGYRPLAGARVTVRGANASAVTDLAGAFTLNGLDPATYSLVVDRIGYESIGLAVEVVANKVARTVVTLAALPVVEPFVESRELRGYFGCAAGTFVTWVNPCYNDPNNANHFRFDLAETVETLVLALEWGSTGYLAGSELQVLVEACTQNSEVTCPPERTYASAVDGSPIVIRIDGEDLARPQPFVNGTAPVRVRVFPGASEVSDASVVLQQSFRVHLNLFHHEPAPPGFTGIPDA